MRNEFKDIKPGMLIKDYKTSKIHYVIRVYEDFIIVDNDALDLAIRHEIEDDDIREVFGDVRDSELDFAKVEWSCKMMTRAYFNNNCSILDEKEEAEFKAFIYHLDSYGQDNYLQLISTTTGKIYDVDVDTYAELTDTKTKYTRIIPYNLLTHYKIYNKLYEEAKLPI